ncbi:hypothetical protein VNO78_12434 [Psophocarpus tetragonolobus]|uniref:Uncharacterized protein n=1 Tax=Psophocarpus tetragonolobus TaxID=3891 RepID=A0AAN9SVJ7_PSOTE
MDVAAIFRPKFPFPPVLDVFEGVFLSIRLYKIQSENTILSNFFAVFHPYVYVVDIKKKDWEKGLNLISSGAFSVMSLSLSKANSLPFESGMFSFFLASFVTMDISWNWKFGVGAEIFSYVLFITHTYRNNSHKSQNKSCQVHPGAAQVEDSRHVVSAKGMVVAWKIDQVQQQRPVTKTSCNGSSKSSLRVKCAAIGNGARTQDQGCSGERKGERLDAVSVFPSMPEVMRLNKLGSFNMS